MSLKAPPKPIATLLSVGIEVPGATCCRTLDEAAAQLRDVAYEVLLAAVPASELLAWTALSHAVLDTAVVAVLPELPDDATQLLLLERGVQDIVVPAEGAADALLGIFDAIAPAASAALAALAAGDKARFHAILAPTVPLSRHIFKAPTRFYKTGVVFMAWLNGHQDHFAMVGGQQSARSLPHFAELLRLADAAGLIEQPELAVRRMRTLLALHGVDA
jgi:hypothetical protein